MTLSEILVLLECEWLIGPFLFQDTVEDFYSYILGIQLKIQIAMYLSFKHTDFTIKTNEDSLKHCEGKQERTPWLISSWPEIQSEIMVSQNENTV